MKTPILVLTDFRPAGQQALHYAVLLAQHLHLELVILHAFHVPSNYNAEVREKMRRLREENVQLEFRKIKNKYEVYSYQGSEEHLRIRTEASEAPLHESICQAAGKYHPMMLVMGNDNEQQLSHLLSGGKTRKLIEDTRLPVLVVPLDVEPSVPRNIVYATDLKKPDAPLFEALLNWTDAFAAEIDTVHITTDTATTGDDLNRFLLLEEELSQNPDYERVHFSDEIALSFTEGLDEYLAEHPADMLVMVTRKYPIWKQCLRASRTRQRARYTRIPLLTLSEGSLAFVDKSEAS